MGKILKRTFSIIMVVLMLLTSIPLSSFVGIDWQSLNFGIESSAENIPSYKKAILNVDLSKIRGVGCQNGGQACACFSLAYCTTIIDNRVHYYSEYNLGSNQYDAICNWASGNFLNNFFPTNENDAYFEMYKQIVTGNPVVVKVTGTRSSHHYVAVVGVENVTSINSLSPNNFLILDPAVSVFNIENMGAVGYKLKLEQGVYQVVRNGTGKIVGLNSIESITQQPTNQTIIIKSYPSHCTIKVTEKTKR